MHEAEAWQWVVDVGALDKGKSSLSSERTFLIFGNRLKGYSAVLSMLWQINCMYALIFF